MEIEIYCPKCGHITIVDSEGFSLGPGEEVFTCYHCKAEWTIVIQFHERSTKCQ